MVFFFLCVRRCEVPECDPADPAQRIYEPEWLKFTTPYKDDDTAMPRKCERYAAAAAVLPSSPDQSNGTAQCSSKRFTNNKTMECRDRWVFEDSEVTIGTEVTTAATYMRDRVGICRGKYRCAVGRTGETHFHRSSHARPHPSTNVSITVRCFPVSNDTTNKNGRAKNACDRCAL